MDQLALWNRFKTYYFSEQKLGFALDVSRVNFGDKYFASMEQRMQGAYDAMESLEAGAIANPDEKRMVGHYWLRSPELAPSTEIRSEIDSTILAMETFAASVHQGKIAPEKGGKFKHLLVVGIGGSALGPQFVNEALSSSADPMDIYFFDNTDPDGMEKVIGTIPDLSKTLTVVISKSGGTKETRNGQLVAKHAYDKSGLAFAKHFVAVTGAGSELDKTATQEKWLARFPMWDWVGGRTSELSAVGLLPAALQGFQIRKMLEGAKAMDVLTRNRDTLKNPAALVALCWHHIGDGRGLKDMVVLPYKDRIELFSRYLQQLLMESLGKEKDLNGKVVNQGIAVYGNKGSTDQHAYVQQLRDGINNFFVVFIEVLQEKSTKTTREHLPQGFNALSLEVEPGVTAGDYLSGFYQGTRKALYESNRESMTITLRQVDDFGVGMLIALFERAVGFYATLVNINAYHQPGVEAGKKAAADVLAVQSKVFDFLKKSGSAQTVEAIAEGISDKNNVETVFKIVQHLAANGRVKRTPADCIFDDKYALE